MNSRHEERVRAGRFIRDGRDFVAVENAQVRLVFWLAHGCDVIEFLHRESECDVLWRNLRLQSARAGPLPLPNQDRSEFFDTFNGGWLSSLPSGFPPGDYYGAPMGTLGEYAQLPWQVDEIR